jgi:transposase
MEINYTRAAKAIGCKFNQDFLDNHKKTIQTINKTISFIINQFKTNQFVDIKNKKNFILADGSELSQAEFNKKYWKHLFGNLEQKGNKGKARDQITAYAVERIVSNANRNKKKINDVRIPRIHDDKSLYIKGDSVKIDTENHKLILSSFLGNQIDIPYNNDISLHMDLLRDYRILKTKKPTTGGNFVLKQKVFIAQIQRSVEPLYEPEDFLGFDINLEHGKWLIFNKSFPELDKYNNKPEEINDIIVKIKTINEKIADVRKPVKERKFRTKERRKQRLHWKSLHKQLNKLCKKIAQEIIDVCIQNKYCLCIDNLASGEKNGTFGQDHLVELLKTMCENQKIPFYSIPTPYTSRTCSECNHQEKDNRKGNEFKCLQCGYEDDSHKNAANNIANFGKEYYNNELPYGRNNNYPNNWSCHTVIKHHKKQSSRSLVNC